MTRGQRRGRRRDGYENPVPLLVCKLPHGGSYVISRDWRSCGRGSLPGRSGQSPQVGCIERPGLHQPGKKAKGSSKYKGEIAQLASVRNIKALQQQGLARNLI